MNGVVISSSFVAVAAARRLAALRQIRCCRFLTVRTL